MKDLRGKVAVVTGAASGIGRALALELAREGCPLAISDVEVEGLEETRARVAAAGAEVWSVRLDVADRRAVHAHADEVVRHFGKVNVLVNNAGVALNVSVEEMTYEDLEWLIGINFWGVVYGTKAFLPHLKRSGEGHIVNVSSVFGLVGVPGQSAYNAAKFAIRGFTESLRQELDIEGCNVSATCVHPGGIRTNIARNARMRAGNVVGLDRTALMAQFDRTARTSAEQAARAIIAAVRKDARRVLIGPDAWLIDRMQRCLPSAYQNILIRAARRLRSATHSPA
jgi:NAD(P)-dependent dehydrogenase (short-subunit alcohol dehydrogenase family)